MDNITLCVAIVAIIDVAIVAYCLSPPIHPRNIPSVPIYATFLPLLTDIDQETLYLRYLAEPLRRHGAVKYFFAARWNILVGSADMMARVMRDCPEDTFRKSGNQEKSPQSVLAQFLGDNVVSASGARWRKYRTVIKRGLGAGWNRDKLRDNAQTLAEILQARGANGQIVAVQTLFQRYMVANTAGLLLQIQTEVGGWW